MKRVRIWLDTTTALLLDRFTGEHRGKPRCTNSEPAADEAEQRATAERACYREPHSGLYLPSAAFLSMLREAGDAHLLPGTGHTLGDVVPVAIAVLDTAIPLYATDHQTRLVDFAVDARSVVNPRTGRRSMRYRPRLDDWSACVDIGIHLDVLAESVVYRLVVEGGERVGLGAFRPACGGSFGRFQVASWESGGADRARVERGERAGETR